MKNSTITKLLLSSLLIFLISLSMHLICDRIITLIGLIVCSIYLGVTFSVLIIKNKRMQR